MKISKNKQNGFSVLEVIIASGILVTITALVFSFVLSSEKNFSSAATAQQTRRLATFAVNRIAEDLLLGGFTDLIPQMYQDQGITSMINLGDVDENGIAHSITFYRALDFDPLAEEVIWEGPITFYFQLAGGETADGIDNNSNGIIDEGMIRKKFGNSDTVLARDVTYLSFSITGTKIEITVEIRKKNHNTGNVFTSRTSTIVHPRNSNY